MIKFLEGRPVLAVFLVVVMSVLFPVLVILLTSPEEPQFFINDQEMICCPFSGSERVDVTKCYVEKRR